MNPQYSRCDRALAAQRGQIIIMIVLIMAIGTGFLVFSLSDTRDLATKRTAQTDAALGQAKEALIGWSAARTPTAGSPTIRPGELPCPDKNNDGMDNDGGCSAGDIGRIPWKTLGIQEPRDGYGETLWYAVAGPFRYKPTNPGTITSDSQRNIKV